MTRAIENVGKYQLEIVQIIYPILILDVAPLLFALIESPYPQLLNFIPYFVSGSILAGVAMLLISFALELIAIFSHFYRTLVNKKFETFYSIFSTSEQLGLFWKLTLNLGV